jgi:glucosamine-6-phosphate deaminase
MEIIIEKSELKASELAAQSLARLIQLKPTMVLGLASGDSPKLLYRELARLEAGGLDLSQITCFSLDEYLGLGSEDPDSYAAYYRTHFFSLLKKPPEKIILPNGLCVDIGKHCCEYEGALKKSGGVDCQILGVGRDGHIGFNEPGSSLASRTRIKTLTPETLKANRKHFRSKKPPKHVLTMGIATILEARRCLVLAFGSKKANAVSKFAEGPVSAFVPASALQLHPQVQVYLDLPAAQKLKRKNYYRYVFENKPAWQK